MRNKRVALYEYSASFMFNLVIFSHQQNQLITADCATVIWDSSYFMWSFHGQKRWLLIALEAVWHLHEWVLPFPVFHPHGLFFRWVLWELLRQKTHFCKGFCLSPFSLVTQAQSLFMEKKALQNKSWRIEIRQSLNKQKNLTAKKKHKRQLSIMMTLDWILNHRCI